MPQSHTQQQINKVYPGFHTEVGTVDKKLTKQGNKPTAKHLYGSYTVGLGALEVPNPS